MWTTLHDPAEFISAVKQVGPLKVCRGPLHDPASLVEVVKKVEALAAVQPSSPPGRAGWGRLAMGDGRLAVQPFSPPGRAGWGRSCDNILATVSENWPFEIDQFAGP
jgi:hypothetical protein